jgi:multidrug resistance efflux pump
MASPSEPLSSAAVERELGRLRLYSPAMLNTAGSHRAFFRWVAGLVLAGVLALFLPWQQNIQGTGVVTALRPQDRPQTLPAAIDGQIREWYVREGQFVRQGELIARISEVKEDYLDPQLVRRTAEQRDAKAASNVNKQLAADALARQVTVLERGLALKLEQTRNKIQQYEADVRAGAADSAFAQNQLERRQAVFDSGLVSLNDFQATQLKFQKAAADLAEKRAGLANARVDLGAVVAEYQKEIVKAQGDRAKTLADATTAPPRWRSSTARSPRSRCAMASTRFARRRTATSSRRSARASARRSRPATRSSRCSPRTRSRRSSCT